ncbi:MAG: META domain-containing protein [Gammaproteobacteria bacterium]|nr:META domain-containing protein [Gammaproteobacteria bacterium]MCB1923720.1 META domain-containing protein [Gammaproteobacteria bacterium]
MSGKHLHTTAALCAASWLVSSVAGAAPLQGSEWSPLRVIDDAVPETYGAFVRFMSKGRLAGHSGCNRLFAEYEAADGQIFVGPVAATRMYCDPALMAFEGAFASALEGARTYRRDGAALVLFDSDGQPILELRQNDWD